MSIATVGSFISRPRRRDRIGFFVILLPVTIAIILSLFSENFLNGENLLNLFGQAAPLLILSLGLLFPVLTGGIDISNGALVSVCAGIIVTQDSSIGLPLAVLVTIFTGALNGVGVAFLKVHPIVMTLGVMIIFLGLSPLILPTAGGDAGAWLVFLVRDSILGVPLSVFWVVITSFLVWMIVARTKFGMRVYAIGANDEAVWLGGVNSRRVIVACYILSSVSAFVTALYIVGRVGSSSASIGEPLIINSITAVAIGGVLLSGGVGSVLGVVFGVFSMVLINNGMNLLSIDPFLQQVITGCILLVAIGFQRREDIGV